METNRTTVSININWNTTLLKLKRNVKIQQEQQMYRKYINKLGTYSKNVQF